MSKKRTNPKEPKEQEPAQSYVYCANCGLDLEGWDDSPNRKPCPKCGSSSRHYSITFETILGVSATVNVRHLSPISQLAQWLAEYHCQEAAKGGSSESRHALATVVVCPIYLDTHLYESMVSASLITDDKYANTCEEIWKGREKIRKEICREHPEATPSQDSIISAAELKWYYFVKTLFDEDFYTIFDKYLASFRDMINIRNGIEHFKEFEVKEEIPEPLTRMLNGEKARHFLDTVMGMARKLDHLINQKTST